MKISAHYVKLSVFGGLTVIFGGLFGYYTNQWLGGTNGSLLIGIISGIVFLTMLLLQSLFVHQKMALSILVIVEGIIMAGVLFWGSEFSIMLFGLIAITLILMVIASKQGQGYIERVLSISIRELGTAMLPLMITAIALVVTVRYVGVNTDKQFAVSRQAAISLLKPGESAVRFFAPNFSFEMSLGEFVRQNADLVIREQLGMLPESARRELVAQAVGQLVNTVGEMLGVQVSAQTAIVDIFQAATNNQLAKIPSAWRLWIWIGFGILVFLTIKGIGLLLGMVVVWLSWAIYKLLLFTGFVSIGYEERQKETILL